MASCNTERLCELIEYLDDLPRTSFDRFLNVLSSDAISYLPEDERVPIWDNLRKFALKHRRFSDTEWALKDDLLTLIEAAADKLIPMNPINLYQRLFSQRELDLYEENYNWEEQHKKFEEKRQKAIIEIMKLDGLNAVIKFVEAVESPGLVGKALGCVAENNIDEALLPAYLLTENRNLSIFISGYIGSRHSINGWMWADALSKVNWSTDQIVQFLNCLPFINETWIKVAEWLGDLQRDYWAKAYVYPYQAEENLAYAVDKLLESGRPNAAIDCLYCMLHKKITINKDHCIRALLSAVSSSEPSYPRDSYHTIELIKMLQVDSEVASDDLFKIEWAYLSLLNRHSKAAPKFLENRLANTPEFFCEIIRLIYKSKKSNGITIESEEKKNKIRTDIGKLYSAFVSVVQRVIRRSKKSDTSTNKSDEERKAIATNAWRLLFEWSTPPGKQEDGSFSDSHFSNWLQRVKEICTESGHLEVALITIGEVLIHCPPDLSGLWMNKTVAKALNSKDSEGMRNGYRTGVFNSRGAHWVDPTGNPERDLANQYRQKAEDVENAGYQRFAVTLRSLAESYDSEADSIIAEESRIDGD